MEQFWFKFAAHNEQSQYGYGTESEASQYEDKLNWSRVYHHFAATKLSKEESVGLEDNSEAFCIYEELASE